MKNLFQKMIENKIRDRIAIRMRCVWNADLRTISLTYHQNAMQETCFRAECTAYGRTNRYILEGKIDDSGDVELWPPEVEGETAAAVTIAIATR